MFVNMFAISFHINIHGWIHVSSIYELYLLRLHLITATWWKYLFPNLTDSIWWVHCEEKLMGVSALCI